MKCVKIILSCDSTSRCCCAECEVIEIDLEEDEATFHNYSCDECNSSFSVMIKIEGV